MLGWRVASAQFILAVMVMLWSSGKVFSVDVATEAFDSGVIDLQSQPTVREEKSATNLAAKILLLDENDVIETKKKRSFSGFGSPLDRLSAGSVDHKGKKSHNNELKHINNREDGAGPGNVLFCCIRGHHESEPTPRKVVEHAKRRFGIPVDRIGKNRLSNSRG